MNLRENSPEDLLEQRYEAELEGMTREEMEILLAGLRKAEAEGISVDGLTVLTPTADIYRDDPAGFVTDILGVEYIRTYQREALERFVSKRRLCIRGPHGIGKSALASWIILWGLACFPDIKIPTTATAWRQLTEFLWPEVHKWALRAKWGKLGLKVRVNDNLRKLRLSFGSNRFAFALAAKDEARIEGAHANVVIYVFDEAREIPNAIWDAAEGAFVGGEGYAFAISTPGAPIGRFYEIQSRKPGYEDWDVLHVTKEDAIREVPSFDKWVHQRERQWGAESSIFRRRALGEFAEDEEGALIPLSFVEAANKRWHEMADKLLTERTLERIGMDVGGEGANSTVIASLYDGVYVTLLEKYQKPDTGANIGFLERALARGLTKEGEYTAYANVDAIGLGIGVSDNFKEHAAVVNAVNVSRPVKFRDKTGTITFTNLRAYLWWKLREHLDPSLTPEEELLALPPDDELIGELVAVRYQMTSAGIKVESKQQIKKRLGKSPDSADAIVLLMYDRAPLARVTVHKGYNPFYN